MINKVQKFKRIIFFALVLIFASGTNCFCAILESPVWDFAIDLPSDMQIVQSTASYSGEEQYHLQSSLSEVQVLVCTYAKNRFANARSASMHLIKSLSGSADYEDFTWRNLQCTIVQANINVAGIAQSSWAVCIELAQNKGYLCVIGFYPTDIDENQEQFCNLLIASTLDGVYAGQGTSMEAGIFTSFAYPKSEDMMVDATIAGQKFSAPIDVLDAEANESVVNREFAILMQMNYAGFAEEACKRFYRMVYRDASPRLRRFAFAMHNALTFASTKVEERLQKRELIAEAVLAWTQDFTYERDLSGSDFTNLPLLIQNKSGDCDSRALLVALLLHHMQFDTAFFVSSVYSHAVVGVRLDDKSGAKIRLNGKDYLLGETTAHVALGKMSAEMNNVLNWVGVSFPY